MHYLDLVKIILLSVVQGITEFLPISSTGHLILVSKLMAWDSDFSKFFFVIIQFGSMLAIFWEYRSKIKFIFIGLCSSEEKELHFLGNVILCLIPVILIGALFSQKIKSFFYAPFSVSIALIIGGVFILLVEKNSKLDTSVDFKRDYEKVKKQKVRFLDGITSMAAFKIGIIQSLALIPGTSRSAATIIGGLFLGLERRVAAEFSFFIAIPLLFGAALMELFNLKQVICDKSNMVALLIGIIVTFFTSIIAIRSLMKYLIKHDFTFFAWYRIILGVLILLTRF